MLDVLDDCDRAEKQMPQITDVQQLKEGNLLIFNKLRNTLQSKGLKAMDSIEKDFDVEQHEAITEIPAPKETLKGKVVDEVQKAITSTIRSFALQKWWLANKHTIQLENLECCCVARALWPRLLPLGT